MSEFIGKLLTPDQLVEKYPGSFSKSWVMRKVRDRETNGMNRVAFKVGKKIFIDEAKFFEWIESHGGDTE